MSNYYKYSDCLILLLNRTKNAPAGHREHIKAFAINEVCMKNNFLF